MGFQWFISLLLSWHCEAFEGQDWFTVHVDGLPNQISLGFFCSGYCISPTGKKGSPILWRKVKNGTLSFALPIKYRAHSLCP